VRLRVGFKTALKKQDVRLRAGFQLALKKQDVRLRAGFKFAQALVNTAMSSRVP
jgi:hypothetical protein